MIVHIWNQFKISNIFVLFNQNQSIIKEIRVFTLLERKFIWNLILLIFILHESHINKFYMNIFFLYID